MGIFQGSPLFRRAVAAPGDTAAPTVTGASVDAAGTTLTVEFSEPVVGTLTGGGGFVLADEGGAWTLGDGALAGDGLSAAFPVADGPVYADDVPLLDYAPGDVEDEAGNALAAFDEAVVANGSEVAEPAADAMTDTFTEAADTDLAAHVSDTGQGWTKLTTTAGQTYTVIGGGGYLQFLVAGRHCVALADLTPGDADYEIEVDLLQSGPGPTAAGPVLRGSGTSSSNMTCYAVRYTLGYGAKADILKFSAGAVVGGAPLASSAVIEPAPATLRARIQGNTITVWADGVQVLSHTDNASPIAAAGQPGLYMYRDSATDAGLRISRFDYDGDAV